MALQTTQVMAVAGGTITLNSAASDPHTVDCSSGRAFLVVANASGDAITVTITTPGTVDGLAVADRAVSVSNGTTSYIPLNPAVYGPVATVAFSGTTDVTFACVALP